MLVFTILNDCKYLFIIVLMVYRVVKKGCFTQFYELEKITQKKRNRSSAHVL